MAAASKGVSFATSLSDVQKKILNEVSWGVRLKVLQNYNSPKQSAYRRVGMQAYKMERASQEDETTPRVRHDESNMKIKLFRLMYETIRDSDVKVKRAEVIKHYYNNSTSFDLGFMMGEITDRFRVMKDIASTMKRQYAHWRPMEHINAYEQIANKAVELCNMVDVARSLMKRDGNYSEIHKHHQ